MIETRQLVEESLINMSKTTKHDNENTADTPNTKAVAVTGPNDVLLGRGYLAVKHEGNINFRKLVQEHQARYSSASEVTGKHEVACDIVRKIKQRKGRFLRRCIEADAEHHSVDDRGATSYHKTWFEVEDSVSIEKVKQTFRDLKLKSKERKKSPKTRNTDVFPSLSTLQAPPRALGSSDSPQGAAMAAGFRYIQLQDELIAAQQRQALTQQAEREGLLRSLLLLQQQQQQQEQISPSLLTLLQNNVGLGLTAGSAPATNASQFNELDRETYSAIHEEHQRRRKVQDIIASARYGQLADQCGLTTQGTLTASRFAAPSQTNILDYLRSNVSSQCPPFPQQQQQPDPLQLASTSLLLGIPLERLVQNQVQRELNHQLTHSNHSSDYSSHGAVFPNQRLVASVSCNNTGLPNSDIEQQDINNGRKPSAHKRSSSVLSVQLRKNARK